MNRSHFARYYVGASHELMTTVAEVGAARHQSRCLAEALAQSAVNAAATPEETTIGLALVQAISETENY